MHVAAFLLAATCGVPLTSHRTEPLQLSKDLLRYRGGGNPPVRQPHQANSVVLAARKLCDAPGMLCAAGASKATMAQRHIRGIVFGGMDGILTTFALLAAAEGTQHTSSSLTLVIGLSTVLADALSMAAGEYLSAKAEDEMAGGASEDEAPPLEKGLAMFVAFTCFGCMPLMAYITSALVAHQTGIATDPRSSFILSTLISALSLFALGGIKSQFGSGVWWRSGMEVTGIGGAAATVAYFTARIIDARFGSS